MTEAAERWSACSIATAAWPRTWRQPADRGVSWRSQGRWRRARPHRPNSETGSQARDLLRPFPAELMRMRPVSMRVNSPKNDDADLLTPAAPDSSTTPQQGPNPSYDAAVP